jgi:predicted nucleotidyltransferase
MHFHRYQELIVGSRTKVRLLRVMFRLPESELTGEDLAHKASVSKPMAHLALSEMMRENVVARRVTGRAYLYRLLADSYPVKLVAPLFIAEDSPLEELARLAGKKLASEEVISVILYGSIVRGEEEAESDIDLYVIIRNEAYRERVQQLVSDLNRLTLNKFGNRLSALILTRKESRRAYTKRRGLEMRTEAEGRVLYGLALREAVQ